MRLVLVLALALALALAMQVVGKITTERTDQLPSVRTQVSKGQRAYIQTAKDIARLCFDDHINTAFSQTSCSSPVNRGVHVVGIPR
jgi:hypothetical protein